MNFWGKVYIVGAGPADADLITMKGYKLLKESDVVVYAGSLVNKDILNYAEKCKYFYDSSKMNLDEIISVIKGHFEKKENVVRLHTGDPSVYGAIYEQMIELDKLEIPYEIVPGVTSLFLASAKLKTELTAPEISQTVIISRVSGRTKVPKEESLENLSKVGGTFAFYLSAKLGEKIRDTFINNGWDEDTPVAVCYRVGWPGEKILLSSLKNFCDVLKEEKIEKHAIIIIGKVLKRDNIRAYSKLYDKRFEHEYRKK